MSSLRAAVVWSFVPVSIGAVVAGHLLEGEWANLPVPLMLVTACTTVGALIVVCGAGNRVGWLLSGFGLQLGLSVLALALAHTDWSLALWAAWIESSLWTVGFVLLVVMLPLIFPDGTIRSGWPRLVPGVVLVGWLLFTSGNAFRPDHLSSVGFENPTGVPALEPILEPMALIGALLFAGSAVAAAVAAVQRYRASTGVARLQHRWFAISAVILVGSVGAMAVAFEADRDALAFTSFGIGATTVPVAIGVAILRYRLYDIDRVVSRVVAYAVVMALLALVYVGGVVGFGAIIRVVTGGGGGDLVVAASTLAVAALFSPVRRRVQTVVDRRFNRARYDARDALERFTQRTRDEVDLTSLDTALRAAVATSLQPARVSVWMNTSSEENP